MNGMFALRCVQSGSNQCGRVARDKRLSIEHCDLNRGPEPDTVFELTTDGRLLVTASGQCLTVTNTNYIIEAECEHPLTSQQVNGNIFTISVSNQPFDQTQVFHQVEQSTGKI